MNKNKLLSALSTPDVRPRVINAFLKKAEPTNNMMSDKSQAKSSSIIRKKKTGSPEKKLSGRYGLEYLL